MVGEGARTCVSPPPPPRKSPLTLGFAGDSGPCLQREAAEGGKARPFPGKDKVRVGWSQGASLGHTHWDPNIP